jgi:BirA family transcriptional regulator, biotin operon repressor / biotin---[acetyl-CoA-carboxylase] ligase
VLKFDIINSNNILQLSSIDSTNTYAQSIVNKAITPHNTIIQALHQTAGRGQRNNTWVTEPNTNLLMSIIIGHQQSELDSQFVLNMAVCLGIVDAINNVIAPKQCAIKWSNDIYIDDKKVAGVLIENSIRGNTWANSIVGIGININQTHFDENLPNATSIFLQTNRTIVIDTFRDQLIKSINLQLQSAQQNSIKIIKDYNAILYKKNSWQLFESHQKTEKLLIESVNEFGQLVVNNGVENIAYAYSEIKQIIGG